MRSHALRLYVFSVTLLVFFVLWAVIAAKPWAARARGSEPGLNALNRPQRHLEHEARVVERTVHRRWAGYRRRLREREAQIRTLERRHAAQLAAANARRRARCVVLRRSRRLASSRCAPQVRVVTLPPAGPSTSSGSSHP